MREKPFQFSLRPVLALTTVFVVLGLSPSAFAHKRWFAYTYDWYVPYRFEREIEIHWIGQQNGDWLSQIEYEYGVDGHFAIAPYLLVERKGGEPHFQGWKLETRYSFGEATSDRLLHGAYFEVAKERDEPYELEGKWIGTVESSRGWVWSGNLIGEREMESRQPVKWGYSTGLARPVNNKLHIYAEAFGNWTEKEHFIGPGVGLSLGPGSQILATAGFSTTKSGNQFKLLYEIEF